MQFVEHNIRESIEAKGRSYWSKAHISARMAILHCVSAHRSVKYRLDAALLNRQVFVMSLA